MTTDLIIDGNYILSKSVFVLHKNNLLFGGLHKALEATINNYRKWYPFANVYMVSDSREKSWRKELLPEYKGQRKSDSEIDWQFVYQAYGEFKNNLKGIKILEAPSIEGDDWITFLAHKANEQKKSTVIVSNDYDIKQLIQFRLDPLTINIMTNEMSGKEKIFLPKNYLTFLNKVNRLPNNDIFALNDNSEFLKLLDRFINKYEIIEIDPVEALFTKIVSGDTSDNISSVWKVTKNGKSRGIGAKGAKSFFTQYLSEFGDVNFNDPDIFENIADLICEKKNLPKSTMGSIVMNLSDNMKLIDLTLSNLPKEILEKMNTIYENDSKK